MTDDSPHIDIENLTVGYNGHIVLSGVSMAIPLGASVAVVGPNGAGKSTLLQAVVGLLPPAAGQIRIRGLPLGRHRDRIAYMPQRERVDWRFPVNVIDVVMMGRYGHLRLGARPGPADRAAVAHALDRMHIADLAEDPIGELSGGQQQRVFVARALAQEPDILVLDEPLAGIDAGHQTALLSTLADLRKRQLTMLVSTHDLSIAGAHFDLVLLMNGSRLALGRAETTLTAENLRRVFGLHMPHGDGGALWIAPNWASDSPAVDELCGTECVVVESRRP